MNETELDLRAAPRAAKVMSTERIAANASASETTLKVDDAGESAKTSRLPSPPSTATPRSEPSDRSWLIAVLVIGTIALFLGMLLVIEINAGLVTLDWAGPNAVFGVV